MSEELKNEIFVRQTDDYRRIIRGPDCYPYGRIVDESEYQIEFENKLILINTDNGVLTEQLITSIVNNFYTSMINSSYLTRDNKRKIANISSILTTNFLVHYMLYRQTFSLPYDIWDLALFLEAGSILLLFSINRSIPTDDILNFFKSFLKKETIKKYTFFDYLLRICVKWSLLASLYFYSTKITAIAGAFSSILYISKLATTNMANVLMETNGNIVKALLPLKSCKLYNSHMTLGETFVPLDLETTSKNIKSILTSQSLGEMVIEFEKEKEQLNFIEDKTWLHWFNTKIVDTISDSYKYLNSLQGVDTCAEINEIMEHSMKKIDTKQKIFNEHLENLLIYVH